MKENESTGMGPIDHGHPENEPNTEGGTSAVPSSASMPKCSYCGKSLPGDQSRFRPFCSRRCQQLDLRNWLTESYGLPFESEEAEFLSQSPEN